MWQMIYTGHHHAGEHFAISYHAAYGYTGNTNTVISAISTNQSNTGCITHYSVITNSDLQCSINRLRTRVSEKYFVQSLWCHLRNSTSQAKSGFAGHLKRRAIIHRFKLLLNSCTNTWISMPQWRAPQPR